MIDDPGDGQVSQYSVIPCSVTCRRSTHGDHPFAGRYSHRVGGHAEPAFRIGEHSERCILQPGYSPSGHEIRDDAQNVHMRYSNLPANDR